ncbi:rhodanese-like domain-containing protein [uncultured Campylobacter sp.]|uniref:rhodanese-like domain-containing protein n=1 Tax=uncultured Campylobacter sp. TaxID=218934 RepID=UPI00260ACB84|nr:rhodanese-like domain-containing protein [uncultured Campylobacter sp.]
MKFISHKILKSAVLLAVLGSFATCGAETQQPSGYAISGAALSAIEEDNRAKENYLVIDVRSADEYAAGHVKHAINIPLGELESRLDEINDYKDKNVVLYCNTGNRSGKALDLLKQKGFNVLMNAPGVKQYDYELYKVGSINAEGFLKIANEPNVLIIDVREKKDYDAGHMKGAINIPDGEPLENYKDVLEANKDKTMVTHCYSGNRSAKLAQMLSDKGYKVLNLLDGTKEYNYELVK